MKLVVGLGNPGDRYAGTRHNIGFEVVQRLASVSGIALKKSGHQGLYGTGRLAGGEATLLLPQTFMNLSGASVGSACKSLGVEPGDLIVVHDDIDLDFGVLKIRSGGGHGGHNGIRHIREVLGTGDFIRVKVGIGRPVVGQDVSGYVLSRFSAAERKDLDAVLIGVTDSIETILNKGVLDAMNAFNNKNFA
jgi:PTH1 family peptidyl-tRNA hydrolase